MEDKLKRLQEVIGYSFKDIRFLYLAMTHSSYANEHRSSGLQNNERLEFLGDAVLELISSDYLYRHYADLPEGRLTKLRASLVCESSLAQCARDIGLPECIRLGRGEETTGGRKRDSVVSDAMEALIGAVYLDGGITSARKLVRKSVMKDIESRRLFVDSKTVLQEILQKNWSNREIHYELTGEDGPDHAKVFRACVRIGERVLGEGEGSTKKAAQQQAAYHAILRLKEEQE